MDPARLACCAVLAAIVLAGGDAEPHAIVAVLASVAALVAARERRHRAMAITAGIAAGASSAGLALLPVLLGTAIARRETRRVILFPPAVVATALLIGWVPGTDASLAIALPHDLLALMLATATGAAVWIGACCAAHSPRPRELNQAALLACLALPLLAPVGAEIAGLAIALALGGTAPTLRPIARAANDDPLPLRALSA